MPAFTNIAWIFSQVRRVFSNSTWPRSSDINRGIEAIFASAFAPGCHGGAEIPRGCRRGAMERGMLARGGLRAIGPRGFRRVGPGWHARREGPRLACESTAGGSLWNARRGERRAWSPARAASAGAALGVEEGSSASAGLLQRACRVCGSLWKFSRPHTVAGTFVSIVSVSLLAVSDPSELGVGFLVGLAQALVPALLMNVAIVGLNQLFDVDIDRINKPNLPLASGELSMSQGGAIVAATAAAALAAAWATGSAPLLATVFASWVLGVAYSTDVPLLRWKRHPVLAAGCILAVRAVLVQLGFYLHMASAVLGRPPSTASPALAFLLAVMVVFSVVIALFKDVPDVEGDDRAGLKTLSVRLGSARVLRGCVWALQATYAAAALFAALVSTAGPLSRAGLAVSHAALAALLHRRARDVDVASPASMYDMYMFVWKLFYAEYLLVPLFR